MEPASERSPVPDVVAWLAKRFPTIPESRVAEVVQSEYDSFVGRPVRQYIPILIEHTSKDALRAEA